MKRNLKKYLKRHWFSTLTGILGIAVIVFFVSAALGAMSLNAQIQTGNIQNPFSFNELTNLLLLLITLNLLVIGYFVSRKLVLIACSLFDKERESNQEG